MYALLPILIPTFMSLAIVRLALASRRSTARIKLLESDKSGNKLIHILAQLEKDVEDAVTDFIEDVPSAEVSPSSSSSALTKKKAEKLDKTKPILQPIQKKIVMSLNKLPIKKELAYFPFVRNSHAMIISRDVKRFPAHKEGESVLRHWADHFEL
jgi:hypothetical protein